MVKLSRSDTWFCFIASYAIATWSFWGAKLPALPEGATWAQGDVLLAAHALQMIFSFCILVFLFKVVTPWVEWALKKLADRLRGGPKDDS